MRHEATTWRRHLGWPGVVIAVVLLILVGAAALVYRAIRVSLEAEHTLHANYLVLDVVTSHLQRQDAGWPRSWEELVETVPQASWAWYEWPRDVDELRQRVEIDFSLATSDVADMTEDNFSAIRPVGPQYPVSDGAIAKLLHAARRDEGRADEGNWPQAEIERSAIAAIAKQSSLRTDQLEATATEGGDDWRVLVTYIPATPGAHWFVVMSKTGEVKEIIGGK